MRTRKIGNLEVSAVGLGTMGFSHGYGPGVGDDEAIDLMRKAFDLGCTFFDTAEGYAAGENERLVGRALAPIRDQVVIATKFRVGDSASGAEVGRQIRARLEASLTRLGTEYVELYYQHRVSPSVPVEDVAAVMGELIAEGKIGGWGQSQATVEQIRRAHAVTPITAIQSEYSIMERMFERDVIPACEELGIGFVPFSPLASGFLSGKGHCERHLQRRRRAPGHHPVRQGQHGQEPAAADLLHAFAGEKGATPAQVSLAWMLHKKPSSCPSPARASLSASRRTSAPPTST